MRACLVNSSVGMQILVDVTDTALGEFLALLWPDSFVDWLAASTLG